MFFNCEVPTIIVNHNAGVISLQKDANQRILFGSRFKGSGTHPGPGMEPFIYNNLCILIF